MKKLSLSVAALALCSASAFAADLPSRKEAPVYVPPPPVLTWTGFYVGVNVGGGWSAGNGNSNAYNLYGMNGGVTNNVGGGVIGGGQVGYNYQMGSFLVGVETDFQGSSLSSSSQQVGWVDGNGVLFGGGANPAYFGYQTGKSLNWLGTVRGRIGYAIMPSLLIYGTGGFAYGDVSRVHTGYWGQAGSAVQTGWTAGGGVEWMFMPNWSAKAEYLYTDISGGGVANNGWYAGNAGVGLNSVNNHTRVNTVRAGVNYHFNWGAAAPTLARY